jgi:DNA-binding FadR family transcriptional regulator
LPDKVTQQLADANCDGQLLVGSRLPSERNQGEQTSISRTVIWEAMPSFAWLHPVGPNAEETRRAAEQHESKREQA